MTNRHDLRLDQFHRDLEQLKSEIRVEDYAGEIMQLSQYGNSHRGVCPLHPGATNSNFTVFPDTQSWHCFKCKASGDVVHLCQAYEKHPKMWSAMQSLARRYNVQLRGRPKGWHVRQAEKAEITELVEKRLARLYQRRLFRCFATPLLADIEDPDERHLEARRTFKDFYAVGLVAAKNRMAHRG